VSDLHLLSRQPDSHGDKSDIHDISDTDISDIHVSDLRSLSLLCGSLDKSDITGHTGTLPQESGIVDSLHIVD